MQMTFIERYAKVCTFTLPRSEKFSSEQLYIHTEKRLANPRRSLQSNPSGPNDPNSDTYLMLIIQSVFSLKEYSTANAILTRAVLEAIFDENHLSTKIDTDIIDKY